MIINSVLHLFTQNNSNRINCIVAQSPRFLFGYIDCWLRQCLSCLSYTIHHSNTTNNNNFPLIKRTIIWINRFEHSDASYSIRATALRIQYSIYYIDEPSQTKQSESLQFEKLFSSWQFSNESIIKPDNEPTNIEPFLLKDS